MPKNTVQQELINLIQNYNTEYPNQIKTLICDLTDQLQVNYPIEDEQLLIDEFNQTLAGIWQNVLFESTLKYGTSYLQASTDMEILDLTKEQIQNNYFIVQNGSENWYIFEKDQLRIANVNDLIDLIEKIDIDEATENAVNWDEIECDEPLQKAIGLYN